MDNSKRARSEKSRTQPRDCAYVESVNLQRALERIRQVACRDNTLIPNSVCASPPEVGAQCGSSARWDLCGGRRVTGVPTATHRSFSPFLASGVHTPVRNRGFAN